MKLKLFVFSVVCERVEWWCCEGESSLFIRLVAVKELQECWDLSDSALKSI